MANFIERLLGREDKSASNAKERLKLVLSHDRSDLPPGALEEIKDAIIEVISRRIDIDPASVRIEMAQDGREQRLIADIPLRASQRRRNKA
jgi:cell division topological specificity factor